MEVGRLKKFKKGMKIPRVSVVPQPHKLLGEKSIFKCLKHGLELCHPEPGLVNVKVENKKVADN